MVLNPFKSPSIPLALPPGRGNPSRNPGRMDAVLHGPSPVGSVPPVPGMAPVRQQGDERALCPEKRTVTVVVGANPQPPQLRIPLRNQGFLITHLVSRSGSSMRKSFAVCEAFGLTPFPSPWIPSAREGLSAGTGRPGRLLQNLTPPPARLSPGNAHTRRGRPSAPCTALRAARCKCRYGLLREGQGWGWRTTTAVRHAPVARP